VLDLIESEIENWPKKVGRETQRMPCPIRRLKNMTRISTNIIFFLRTFKVKPGRKVNWSDQTQFMDWPNDHSKRVFFWIFHNFQCRPWVLNYRSSATPHDHRRVKFGPGIAQNSLKDDLERQSHFVVRWCDKPVQRPVRLFWERNDCQFREKSPVPYSSLEFISSLSRIPIRNLSEIYALSLFQSVM
jgi:hypothetical protein